MKKLLLFLLVIMSQLLHSQIYSSTTGVVDFVSDAPLEIIRASSNELQGVLDLNQRTFAFKMFIKSFEGFNNPLQQVHFYENYMESEDYPISIFKGKLIDPVAQGKNSCRAKGELEIHGVTLERIIEVDLDISDNEIAFESDFIVPLDDHSIDLPRIVYQKIAQEIKVKVKGVLNIRE